MANAARSVIKLQASTPLEKEVAKRVKRGFTMLDEVTPGWFEPINPATLAVSNRQFCVFAQAQHSFKTGIIQVAEAAAQQGKKVKTLPLGAYTHTWRHRAWGTSKSVTAESSIIDVFHYGFDVDEKLEQLAENSRRRAWGVIDKMWQSVVKQKKGVQGTPLREVKDVLKLLRDEELMREVANETGGYVSELKLYADALRERIAGLR